MTRNLSREAHLWHTITSPEYLDRARNHLQTACDFFIASAKRHPLIADYAPVPYWGGVMELLLQTYSNARAMLALSEYGAMREWGGGLKDIPRGIAESSMSWMTTEDEAFFKSELNFAYGVCSRFGRATSMSERYTSDGYKTGTKNWRTCIPKDVGYGDDHILNCEDAVYAPRPAEIPEYAADKSVSCKTGQIVPWTGVWVPANGMGKAALAFARQGIQIMQPAYHLIREDEDTGEEEYDLIDCIWHPVRPTSHLVPLQPLDDASAETSERERCEAGQPCPHEGFWHTPAKSDSRRFFKAGEIMPAFESDWGDTVWLRDENQQ